MMMPDMNGAATTQAIKARFPDIQVVLLSSLCDEDSVRRVMQAGASGYLVKDVSISVYPRCSRLAVPSSPHWVYREACDRAERLPRSSNARTVESNVGPISFFAPLML